MKERKRLFLYVWENVLTDYASGVMFALAENVEQARALIRACEGVSPASRGLLNTDLLAEPRVISRPEGFAVWGGG